MEIGVNNGTGRKLTFENCNFTVSDGVTLGANNYGAFVMTSSADSTSSLIIDGATFTVPSTLNKPMILSKCTEANIQVKNTTLDMSGTSQRAIQCENGVDLLLENASIKTNGEAIYLRSASNAKNPISVVLSGNTHVLSATNLALRTGNSNATYASDVSVVMKDSAKLESDGTYAYNAIGGEGCSLSLSMSGSATIDANKNGAIILDNASPYSSATITMNDNSYIVSRSTSNAVLLNSTPTTVYMSDNARVNYTKDIAFVFAENVSVNIYNATANEKDKTLTNYPRIATMVDGAAIRMVEGSNGLRFTATGTNADATYGFMLARYADLNSKNCDFSVGDMKAADIKYLIQEIPAEKLIENQDGTVTFMLSLIGIPEVTEEFAVRAFVKYSIGASTAYVFSDFDGSKNIRSIRTVANSIVEEAKAHTTADDVCKYNVGENMYSRYTKSHYDLIVKEYAGETVLTPAWETSKTDSGVTVRDIIIDNPNLNTNSAVTIAQLTDLHLSGKLTVEDDAD
ncbi:MAG: hypothetical protein IKJ00_08970, partial [Clostridia bacterium]|nr:hypothetical protein [Clostridia bacterium]